MLIKYRTDSKPIFDVNAWLEEHKPSKFKKSTFWDDVYLEYNEVVEEFKELLFSKDTIVDEHGNQLSQIQIYNAIEEYKIRIRKLMLIFNCRLYKTYNVNKKTNVRYIVMRAFWLDHFGKPVKYFSRNLGAENKVLSHGKIPKHMLDSVEEDILHLMWDQYTLDLNDNYLTSFDDDGNTFIVND